MPVAAVGPIETLAKEREAAHEAPAHGPAGNTEARGDLGRREVLVVTQQEGRSERLLERGELAREALLGLEPLREFVRRLARRELPDRALALGPAGLPAVMPAREVLRHRAQPGSQAPRGGTGQGRKPGLLHEVIRRGRVAQKCTREPPQPARMPLELVCHRLAVRRAHVCT